MPESIETKYKLNRPVIAPSGSEGKFDSLAVDVPFVFHHNGQFYMMYTGFDGIGYQTGLAVSGDLLNWTPKGVILPRNEGSGWDKVGAAGTWIIKESDGLYDLPTLKKIDGKYWMIYHSYPQTGYESGSAETGLAWTDDESLMNWHRLEKPVLSWRDGAEWEIGGLYKSCVVTHEGKYYMFYNAKNKPDKSQPWREQTGLAISSDLLHWERYPESPVLRVSEGSWDSRFVSDPGVFRGNDKWLMFFFGFDGIHAQDGVAYSQDLLHWEKDPNPIIKIGEAGALDSTHAHKPAVVYYNGVLYHFYCACGPYHGDNPLLKSFGHYRCLTVATSEKLT
jgi:predicted GH43/DUF377 family glycosyl hydrolase